MSSPGGGGGTKNKLNMETFNNLKLTPKILFIIGVIISILGLLGALIGATSSKKSAVIGTALLIGLGISGGSGYWAYTIFTDKKNLKSCNASFWNAVSTYTYEKPTRDPDDKNISLCDAQKKAEYDNDETKWFLTAPNGSNVDVWYYTEKTVSVKCPGPCTLYTANSTTTKRKSDSPTNTNCSSSSSGGGGSPSNNRSPGSGSAGGGGTCTGSQPFSKGTGSGCDATTPQCHDGQRGRCCTNPSDCGFASNNGVQLTCNPKTNLLGSQVKYCCDPGSIWSTVLNKCVTPGNNSDCADNTDCGATGNQCLKASGATSGKCCPSGQVLGPDGNCSAGTDGATCSNNDNCATGKTCVNNRGGGKACCPNTPSGYEWYPTGGLDGNGNTIGKCLLPTGRSLGDTCNPINNGSECTSGICDSNTSRCRPSCGSNQVYSASCGGCVNANEGSCCNVQWSSSNSIAELADSNQCKNTGTGATCRRDDVPTSNNGICCPSGKEKSGNVCRNDTNRANEEPCLNGGDCASGNCFNGICKPGGYCEADEQCGNNEAGTGSRPCINNTCKACRDSNDCGSCRFCTASKSCANDPNC